MLPVHEAGATKTYTQIYMGGMMASGTNVRNEKHLDRQWIGEEPHLLLCHRFLSSDLLYDAVYQLHVLRKYYYYYSQVKIKNPRLDFVTWCLEGEMIPRGCGPTHEIKHGSRMRGKNE